jgi:MFS family permease
MNTEQTPTWRKSLALLRAGPFRRYIMGSIISDTGTWMQVMAQNWVVSTLTDKAIILGLVNLAAGLPTLALTMYGGSVADRFDKRRILVYTNAAQIVLALVLAVLVMTNRVQIWHVIVLAAFLGMCIAFEMPAISALVPELVRHDEIGAAVALDRSVFHGSRLIGPTLAGQLVTRWGAASAIFANAVSFLGLITAILTLPPRPRGTQEEEDQRKSGIMDGFRYVKSDRIMILMIALIALTTVFVFPVLSVMLPLYVRNILHLGPDRMGYLMAISGTGSLAGSLGFLSISREHRFQFMTANAVAVAFSLFCMSLSYNFWLTALAMGFLAIGLSMNFALANTIVQERAPSPLRGRISAVFGLSFFGLMPMAGLGVTGLSDLIGMRNALGIASVCFGIGAFLVLNFAGRRECDAPRPRAEAAATTAEPVIVP